MGAISDVGPLAWWKFNNLAGLVDGDPISSVSDSSANGYTASQSGTARPTYKTVSPVPAGLGAAQFDGSNDYLTAAAPAHDTAGTVFAVIYLNAAATNKGIIGSSASNGLYWNLDGSNLPTLHRTNVGPVSLSDQTTSPGAWHVLAVKYTTSSVEHRVDGARFQFGPSAPGYSGTGTTVIGSYASAVEPFYGYIGELVRFTGALTDAQVVGVEQELAAKWGVSVISGESVSPTMSASSTAAGGGNSIPAKLIDGLRGATDANAWAAATVPPQWAQADLGTAQVIGSYMIAPRLDAPAFAPAAWTLDGSNDLSSWTTLDTRSGQTFAARDVGRYKFANSTAYRYYRLNISATGNGNLPTFSEWQLYKQFATASTTGAVVMAAPIASMSATGVVSRVGAVSATAPSPALSVNGSIVTVTSGTVAATAPAPVVAVAGSVAGISSGEVTATAPSPTLLVQGTLPTPTTGSVSATAPAPQVTITDSTVGGELAVGVTIEVGALTLLNLVALPGVEVPVGVGVESGDAQSVVPLPGISVEVGCSLIGRQIDIPTPDPRRQAPQWRYVVTDLANTPLGELTDFEHDAVEDGVGEPATMQFTIATDSDQHALIKPIERQCQVWEGDRLLLRGPILPGQPNDDGTSVTYKIHDPSWFWRDGRRVITRTPQKNLIRNGDFKSGLTGWVRGYDRDSIPKAAPNVRVVAEDFADDTDGLDPIKAAEITGVESVTEAELSSNAVFWPNLATFRPGGKASIETLANAMPSTAGLKVSVVGHTANDGTGNGLGLSLRRAQAAAAIIHAKRPGAVITTKGVGFYDPKPGFPKGSQEQRRVVISYDQTISGESKQWMRQTIEVTQPKEARYPLVLTFAAMLKVADDWSIEDANMMSLKILARRKVGAKPPTRIAEALAEAKVDYNEALADYQTLKATSGTTADELASALEQVREAKAAVTEAQNDADSAPWDEQIGVGSSSISDTDPVDRWIPQTAEATIPADGRAHLVDVYLYAPAALARYTAVGLFPEEMLYFWGKDQSVIFKGVMEHIQKPEFGYADLNVATRTPLTGVKRDREFAFRDLTPADTALDGLMGISRGLEWDTVTTATKTTATTFYPRQGKAVDYVLALGANVVSAVPANTRDVGSAIIAQAQGLGSYRAVAYANDTKAFGGTLIQRVVTAEQDTPLNELRETAKAELFWARSSTPAYWVDIDPDSVAEVLANTAKGDTVRLILDHPTAVDRLARIVRRQIHPDSLRLMLAFEEV